jgi:hypothetical protein
MQSALPFWPPAIQHRVQLPDEFLLDEKGPTTGFISFHALMK